MVEVTDKYRRRGSYVNNPPDPKELGNGSPRLPDGSYLTPKGDSIRSASKANIKGVNDGTAARGSGNYRDYKGDLATLRNTADRHNWVNLSFATMYNMDTGGSDDDMSYARVRSDAITKWQETSPGGNSVINPLPQMGILTDPPPEMYTRGNLHPDNIQPYCKLGAYYSEMYDNTKEVVYFRFGVPVYNSLSRSYSRIYNPSYAGFVKTGSIISDSVRGFVHGVTRLALSPLLLASKVVGTIGIARSANSAAESLLLQKSSKLYTFKPTMHLYWATAQTIFNSIMTLMDYTFASGGNEYNDPSYGGGVRGDIASVGGEKASSTSRFINTIAADFPDVFKGGTINLLGIASKARTREIEYFKALGGTSDYARLMGQIRNINNTIQRQNSNATTEGVLGVLNDGSIHGKIRVDGGTGGSQLLKAQDGATLTDIPTEEPGGLIGSLMNHGLEYIAFRVNDSGGAQESFSNSFRDAPLASFINETSSTARSIKTALNYGNVGENVLLSALGGFFTGISTTAAEIGNNLGLSAFSLLTGSAFADLPKFWDNSTAQLTSSNYSIDLSSVHGNDISRILTQMIPLSLALPMVLPRSTGGFSYTEPFLCQMFNKGKSQVKMGMVRSLSITRGDGSAVNWNEKRVPLSIKITIEVESMDSVLHMPLAEVYGSAAQGVLRKTIAAGIDGAASTLGSFFGGGDSGGGTESSGTLTKAVEASLEGSAGTAMAQGWTDVDSALWDYMAVLASTDYLDQVYLSRRIINAVNMNRFELATKSSNVALYSQITQGSTIGKVFPAFRKLKYGI